MTMSRWVCGICLDLDGVHSSIAHTTILTHPEHGYRTECTVCSRCSEWGRDTRVTCLSWLKVEEDEIDNHSVGGDDT